MLVFTNLNEADAFHIHVALSHLGHHSKLMIVPMPSVAYFKPLVFLSAGEEPPGRIVILTTPKGADPEKLADQLKVILSELLHGTSPITVVCLGVDQHQEEGDEEYPYLAVTIK